jgi:hypothetical protein
MLCQVRDTDVGRRLRKWALISSPVNRHQSAQIPKLIDRPGQKLFPNRRKNYFSVFDQGRMIVLNSFIKKFQCDLLNAFLARLFRLVRGISEAVKDRLLDWSIELEQQGILGDNMSFKDQEKEIAKNQTFNIEHMTGFIGDVSHSKFELYDYSSIYKTLKEASVPKAERDDLEQIMDDLKVASPEEKPGLLEKAKSWVVKNQEFLGATVSIVMKALGQSA